MASNTILTPRMILRKVYAIMHQKSNFIMRTNRQYDNRFAQVGAKIGQTLDVRLPPKYTTRRGNVMQEQEHVERSVPLPLTIIDGVDLNFSQEDLTFSLDDFGERVLDPAVSQLTATVEDEALSGLYKTVAVHSGDPTLAVDYLRFQETGTRLTEQLAPRDNNRTMCFQPVAALQFSDAVKGLFQSSENIREQYREGMLGRTGGFDTYENTLVPSHTVGDHGGTPLVNGAGQGEDGAGNAWFTTTDLVTDGWTASNAILNAGDIITLDGVFDVHAESKKAYSHLKNFVVQEDVVADGGGAATITISPAIITGGAYQNVSAGPADNAPITVVGTATESYGQAIGFHRDAFAFVTADLEDPSQYGAWGGREVMDGLSIRIWRAGDIKNGTFPCRLDIAYGYAAIYPEWAARLLYNPQP